MTAPVVIHGPVETKSEAALFELVPLSAIMASRGAVRMPLPTRSESLSPNT